MKGRFLANSNSERSSREAMMAFACEEPSAWRQHVGRVGGGVLSILRRVMFGRRGSSVGYSRRWLKAGVGLCGLATSICVVLDVHEWYNGIPIIAGALLLLADLSLAFKDKRAARISDDSNWRSR